MFDAAGSLPGTAAEGKVRDADGGIYTITCLSRQRSVPAEVLGTLTGWSGNLCSIQHPTLMFLP